MIGEVSFAYVADGSHWLSLHALGSVITEDDVQIHAHSCIHRGVLSDTRIANGAIIDSHVMIGHDANIGRNTAIAAHSGVAGAAVIGENCIVGGMSGIGEGVEIANGVTVGAKSYVDRSISESDVTYAGSWPAEPSRRWWRRVSRLRELS